MKRFWISMVATAVTLAPLASNALGTNEKGCLVGGAAGGLVGHAVSGNKTLLGAAIGCGAGVLVNKERVRRIDAEKDRKHKQAVAQKRRERERRYAQQEPR